MLTSLEICAGAGGQALGLEMAGFKHVGLVEIEPEARATLRLNRPKWDVIADGKEDIRNFSGHDYAGIDLLAGGVPCPPFSKAGKQLGNEDERDLFPEALRLVGEIQPRAVMLENVRGLMDTVFDEYRKGIIDALHKLGYDSEWRLLNASDFGVPQLRPRVIMIGIRQDLNSDFRFPMPLDHTPETVGETLYDLMIERGWQGADEWRAIANDIAPTIVGGSKKHGGPDLGPTRAKRAWATLGVDGLGISDLAPAAEFVGMPRLTTRMVARIQGFPDDWQFSGKKTAAYRQIGNAFPAPVAAAVGKEIAKTLKAARKATLQRIV